MSRVGEDFTLISSNAETLQQTLSGYDIHPCPGHRLHYTRDEAFRLLITAYLAIDSYTDLARVSKEFGYLLEI